MKAFRHKHCNRKHTPCIQGLQLNIAMLNTPFNGAKPLKTFPQKEHCVTMAMPWCTHVSVLTKNVKPLIKHRHMKKGKEAQVHLSSHKQPRRETVRLTSALPQNLPPASFGLNKRAMISISVCHRVHTGWLTLHVKDRSLKMGPICGVDFKLRE